jgi:hypothetical protein
MAFPYARAVKWRDQPYVDVAAAPLLIWFFVGLCACHRFDVEHFKERITRLPSGNYYVPWAGFLIIFQ